METALTPLSHLYVALLFLLAMVSLLRLVARRYLGWTEASLEEHGPQAAPALESPSEPEQPARSGAEPQSELEAVAELKPQTEMAPVSGAKPQIEQELVSEAKPQIEQEPVSEVEPPGHAPARPGGTLARRDELRPAEIAYLVRGGDVTHAIIVMAVDMLQRALKPQQSQTFREGLSEYESRMWTIVKEAIKNWAVKKARDGVTGGSINPMKIFRRLSFFYGFVTSALKSFLQETIADPQRIRKYFSSVGLMRIIADFTSAGYKQSFETELRASLLRRGYLVEERRRQKVARLFLTTAALSLAGSLAVAVVCMHLPWLLAATLWFFTAAAASMGRGVLSLRQLIPLYDELAVVCEQIERRSWRISALKIVLRSVNLVVYTLAISIMLTIAALGLGLVKLFFPAAGYSEIYAALALVAFHLAIADLSFEALRLLFSECPTRQARLELDRLKADLEHSSPLTAFRQLLVSQSYDPHLSRIVAVYGIETVLFLA